jgi:hypothetical protein
MGMESRRSEKGDIEQVYLLGKEDVLNYDPPNKTLLEQEMLNTHKVEFSVRFTTHSKDASMRIRDMRREINLAYAREHYKTGQTVQVNGV